MGEDPYESPQVSEAASETPVDPLRGPALACLIVSILAICGSILALGALLVVLKMLADLDRPEVERLEREVRDGFIAAAFWFAFGVSGICVAVNMRKRRRRWLVIAWSIVAIGSVMLSPLGIILLMRLWRKDVWQYFK